MSDDTMSRQEVEKLIDKKLDSLKQERMRNQRMINSLQEEVEALRDRVRDSSEEKRGNRDAIELEHKVMKEIADEIQRSRRNVADKDIVASNLSDRGHPKTITKRVIDDLVDDNMLIDQGSSVVPQDKQMEEISFVEDYYEDKLS